MQLVVPPQFSTSPNSKTQDLRALSKDLEAAFLSEMLKHAGLGETPEAFGGGIGEDQFGSMLRDMQAREMVAAGGIGLSEAIFRSLEARENAK